MYSNRTQTIFTYDNYMKINISWMQIFTLYISICMIKVATNVIIHFELCNLWNTPTFSLKIRITYMVVSSLFPRVSSFSLMQILKLTNVITLTHSSLMTLYGVIKLDQLCLTSPKHYLRQCWLIICGGQHYNDVMMKFGNEYVISTQML